MCDSKAYGSYRLEKRFEKNKSENDNGSEFEGRSN